MKLKQLISHIHQLENWVLTFLIGALVVLSFVQISGRLFINRNFSGADQIIYHLVLWVALAGAMVATRNKEHITIDIINRFSNDLYRPYINLLTNLFSTFICLLLTWSSIRFIMDEIAYQSTIMENIPAWPFQLIMPIAFFIISTRFFIHFCQNCQIILKRNKTWSCCLAWSHWYSLYWAPPFLWL